MDGNRRLSPGWRRLKKTNGGERTVQWRFSFGYFHHVQSGGYGLDSEVSTKASAFLWRYRCKIVNDHRGGLYSSTVECSEEDFLIIKLTEPAAIGVYFGTFDHE
jgi:hypothetical protein